MSTKPFYLILFIVFLSSIASTSTKAKPVGPQTLTGEIIDTLCAEHKGHQYMMQQMKSMGTDKQTCIQKCLQLGAKLALFNAADGTVYGIANQDKAVPYEGRQVQVTGTVNKKKITISEIKPLGR